MIGEAEDIFRESYPYFKAFTLYVNASTTSVKCTHRNGAPCLQLSIGGTLPSESEDLGTGCGNGTSLAFCIQRCKLFTQHVTDSFRVLGVVFQPYAIRKEIP